MIGRTNGTYDGWQVAEKEIQFVAERTRGVPIPHLRAWRQAKYLSQLELGERAGLSRITITRAERGESVSFPNIRKLAEALGVTPDDLAHTDPPAYHSELPT